MSRIGKRPVEIPSGVTVTLEQGTMTVKGPRGELSRRLHPAMQVKVENGTVTVERPSEENEHKALHGLTRSLLNNMVTGVSTGFQISLDLVGTGYRAQQSGRGVTFQVGYSHPVEVTPMDGVSVEAESQTRVVVKGADKQKVGQVAAEIRAEVADSLSDPEAIEAATAQRYAAQKPDAYPLRPTPTVAQVESLQDRFPTTPAEQQAKLARIAEIRAILDDPFLQFHSPPAIDGCRLKA